MADQHTALQEGKESGTKFKVNVNGPVHNLIAGENQHVVINMPTSSGKGSSNCKKKNKHLVTDRQHVETIQANHDQAEAEEREDQQSEHDDITLLGNVKRDKEIKEEETSKFYPNPPELGIIFYKKDCEISTDNLHQDNTPVVKLLAEDTKTSKKSFVTLYILIWLPRLYKLQFGHASLARQDPEFYISWWPGNLLNKLIKKPPGTKKSLGEDVTEEGRQPDHVYCVETDKMEAVEEFWRQNQNDTYHFCLNNCIRKVYEALRKAGAPEFIPNRQIISLFLYYWKIGRPVDFNIYCQKNFKSVKYSEFLERRQQVHSKPMHKDMTLAEPIYDAHEVPQQASNTYLQLLVFPLFGLTGFNIVNQNRESWGLRAYICLGVLSLSYEGPFEICF